MGLFSSFLFAADIKKHSKGLRMPSPKEQEYIYKNMLKVTSVQPNRYSVERFSKAVNSNAGLSVSTSAVVNLQYLPPMGNQGQLNSCAAWASCYYTKTWQDAQERGWTDLATNPDHRMSPAFGYNLANGGENYGSSPTMIMLLMCGGGCTTMKDMPVTANTTDYTTWPAADMFKNAITYRAQTAGIIDLSTSAGINSLKQLVANGDIAVIGLEAHDNLECYPYQDYIDPTDTTITISTNNSVYYANGGRDEGGHAMTVIGYDDSITFYNNVTNKQENGAFLIVNQWGHEWGISISTGPMPYAIDTSTGGFIWISYNYLQNLSSYQQAYVMTDRTGYTPTTYGSFSLSHPERGDMNVRFTGGSNPNVPNWSFDCLPNLGGAIPVNQKIYVDLTLYPIDYSKPFWLGVYDSSGTPTSTGIVTGMSVITPDAITMVSSDVPKNTVKNSMVNVELNPIALPQVITLNLPTGPVIVNVPAYAFNIPTIVTVTTATLPSTSANNLIVTGPVVNIDSGNHQPVKPVTITMHYNNTSGIDRNRLAIAYYDNSNNRWVPLISTLWPNANEVSCQTSRLSCTYALVELVPSTTLSSVKAYPNPYKLSSVAQGLTISNLTETADIKIYSMTGQLIRTLSYSNGSGRAVWDGRNDSGNTVASGIYIIYIDSPEGKQKLKVALER